MMVNIREHAERLDVPSAGEPISCEEFQDQMPALLGEDIHQHEHLKTCARCSALLEELEYIVSAARELLPVYEPGDMVWQKISRSLADPPDDHENSPLDGTLGSASGNGHLKPSQAEG